MSRLRVYGRRDVELRARPVPGADLLDGIEVRDAVRLSRDRGEDTRVDVDDVAPDDVLELHLSDGLRLFRRFDDLQEELGSEASRGADGALELPITLHLGGDATRGGESLVIEAVRRLGFDAPGLTAQVVAQRLEERLQKTPGLYRWRGQLGLGERVDPDDVRLDVRNADGQDHPALIFVHGTMSTTKGSFGALPAGPVWSRLVERYGARIYAFEHRTLTRSPLDNAVELLDLLPPGLEVHLVTHSRGGLVGELLCRGGRQGGDPVDDLDRSVFRNWEGGERPDDLARLDELATRLGNGAPRVDRFARVACPAAGTILAGPRLDRYLEVVTNLIGLVPGLKTTPIYDVAVAFLLAVVKGRTDPTRIPGIEAMMPESPLAAMVNRPDVVLDGSLSVIAGDVEPRGVLKTLAVLASDAFFREEHDLVVNTAAMLGGAHRADRARLMMVKGSHVNHFRYFENEDTARGIATALAGSDEGFGALAAARGEGPPRRAAPSRGLGERPTVVVVPGLMGSHLEVDGNRVWLDILDLAVGGMDRVRRDAGKVVASGCVDDVYGDLVEFLHESHHVVPFAYDWRRSLLELGDALGHAVEDVLRASRQPVRIVAHSMGGLVTRAMIHRHPAVWEELTSRRGHRLVLMGTPTRGSYNIPLVLLGREPVLRKLALLDLKHSRRQLLEIVSRFQGLLDLLPDDDFGLFRPEVWETLHGGDADWLPPLPEHLEAARACRSAVDGTPFDPAEVLYVAGQAEATPVAIRTDDDAKGPDRVRFLATRRGDGRVPWATGTPAGATVYYLPGVVHGQIPAHRGAFAAFVELLEEGDTRRLSKEPPVLRGEEDERFELPPVPVDIFPDEAELVAAAMGAEREVAARPTAPPVQVRLVHGNLAFARHVLAVGHYQEDMIVSAESALDYHLHGALRRRHALGAYPGPLNTAEVVFSPPDRRPPGALVVGLGPVGQLTPGGLASTLKRGLLELATAELERASEESGEVRDLGVSALLIGSGEGGLPLRVVLEATVQAVRAVNLALAESDAAVPPAFTELELIELYEDRAIQALETLRTADLPEAFRVEPELEQYPGWRRRIYEEDDPEWWRRIEISGGFDESGGDDEPLPGALDGSGRRPAPEAKSLPWDRLRFKLLTDRARADRRTVWIQRATMDELVGQAVDRPVWDPELAQTLFELLLPNDMKEHSRQEGRGVELVLDEDAACYPWELLEDPQTAGEPVSVRTGLVRRLVAVSGWRASKLATGDYALVVGNPKPIGAELPDLPGATREAATVVRTLEELGVAVTHSIEQRGIDALKALFGRGEGARRGYRILHLAGHGIHRPLAQGGSGLVIGEDQLLGPSEVARLRRMPELVFINCCHLGRVGGRRYRRGVPFHELAANLGRTFIERGVRAVVAAGWAVNDRAAELFAETFYRRMLVEREPFGEAVTRARREVWERSGEQNNTWGAYQCYGDHSFVLRAGGGSPRSVPTSYPYSAPVEAEVDLENLSRDAQTIATRGLESIERALRRIRKRIPDDWLDTRPELRAALGRAYANMGHFDEACRHLEKLAELEPAGYSVRTLEILANAEVRSAYQAWRADQLEADAAEERIRRAISRIDGLRSLGETAERYSLTGSAWKRLAAIRAGRPAEGRTLLDRTRLWYGRAVDHDRSRLSYPILNALYILAVQKWRDPAYEKVAEDWGKRAAAARYGLLRKEAEAMVREARDLHRPNFFNALLEAEVELIEGIWDEDMDPDAFVGAVRRAWHRGGTLMAYRSVDENLDALARILRGAPRTSSGSTAHGIADSLDSLRTRLATVVDEPR